MTTNNNILPYIQSHKKITFMNKLTIAFISMAVTTSALADGPKGIDRANLDTSVAPGTDFYQYACGGWMKANPLSPEYSRFGTFDQLGENSRKQVYDLVTGIDLKNAAHGSNAQKIGDFFALGMDSVRLNREGAEPVKKDLARINSASRGDIIDIMATMPGVNAFFNIGVSADMLNADQNVMYLEQGGLGLGDRDYYIVDNENNRKVLDAYRNCLETLARLAGYSENDARRLAANSISIEKTLARAATSREDLRDPAAQYNPRTMAQLAKDYPNIDLKRFFAKCGINNIENLILGQPKSLAAADVLMATASEQALRDYLTASYLTSAADYLSDDFVNAGFELSKVISGVQQMQPRWKRALAVPNGMLGEALGQLYVEKYFPASSKEKMLTLVGNLQSALGEHIDNLTWMSDATKAKAREKLAAFTVKIGYPDKWRDYSSLDIDPSKSYWENVKNAVKFNNDFNLADFGKPVDRSRWYMSPQTVNAYYNPTTNEICFPAGILQKPFFDPEADDAANYGAIGVVIGHEMTHGFDDQGRQFDKNGNLKDWWTKEDAEAFTKLADGLAAQFDKIIVLGDTHANGRFTLGENIADQGGLRVAHTAYHKALGDNKGQTIDGFTPDQRFYLAYANVWAGNIRDAEILRRTQTDPHSLGKWRVDGSLRNIAPFFEAFSITEGQPMYLAPEERIVIW